MKLGASFNDTTSSTRFIGNSAVIDAVILRELKFIYPNIIVSKEKWGEKDSRVPVDL